VSSGQPGSLPVFWAIVSPVAAMGLVGGFLVGLGLRILAQRTAAWLLGLRPAPRRPSVRRDIDPIGLVSLMLSGIGWGRGANLLPSSAHQRTEIPRLRLAMAVIAGPVAAVAAGELLLAAFVVACPGDRMALMLNRPSDVVHGVVEPTLVAQVTLSAAVGALGFGLLALLPFPPLDGWRLVPLLLARQPARGARTADLIGALILLALAAIPTGQLSPLLTVLDRLGTPLLRLWL
jgi:Zn-dependent protease